MLGDCASVETCPDVVYPRGMDNEMRDLLKRHGMTDEDIERYAEFEARAKKPRKRVKVEQPTLFDF